MSLEDLDEVPEAKSPFSKSATEAPRSARSRATPAPAMPPPITTASSAAPSNPASLVMRRHLAQRSISSSIDRIT